MLFLTFTTHTPQKDREVLLEKAVKNCEIIQIPTTIGVNSQRDSVEHLSTRLL
jgi:hypothetical protein